MLRLAGELDLAGVDLFERMLETELDAGPATVALDLIDLTFMDPSGLRALVMADRRVTRAGGHLVVIRRARNDRRGRRTRRAGADADGCV